MFGCKVFPLVIACHPKMLIRSVDARGGEADAGVDGFDVVVAGARFEEAVNTYLDGRYYPKEVKLERELGCDSASTYVCVNGKRDDVIRFGADGWYGNITKCKEYFGFFLNLWFDAGLFTFEDVEREMCYLFKGKEVVAES